MSSVSFGLVLLALAASTLPLWLLRRTTATHARDWLVAPERMRAQVVRNASIGTTMRAVVFVALFVAGASGDVWVLPALATSFGAGVYLVYLLRRPLLAHVDSALAGDASFSVVGFVAWRCGLGSGVRRLMCSFVLMVLAALVLVEALALRWAFELVLPRAWFYTWVPAAALVLVAAMQAVASGHAAALHAAQLQFGLMYLGLFGSVVVMLYAQTAALVPLGHADVLVLAVGALASVALVIKRRSRCVDIHPICPPGLPQPGRLPLASVVLRRIGKLINQFVSTLVVLAIVIAGMALYGAWSQGTRTVPSSDSGLAEWGVAVLCLILLLHPLVDLAMWQQLAALRLRAGPADLPEEEAEQRVRSTFRAHALQAVALGLLIGMLGSLAAVVTGVRGMDATLSAIPSRLVALDADLGGLLLPGVALALTACALTTMAAQFSAMLCTVRLDLQVGEGFASPERAGSLRGEERYRRRAKYVVLLLASVVAAAAVVVPLPGSTDAASRALIAPFATAAKASAERACARPPRSHPCRRA